MALELSRVAGLSRRHFLRAFRASTQDIGGEQRRVNFAMMLLERLLGEAWVAHDERDYLEQGASP